MDKIKNDGDHLFGGGLFYPPLTGSKTPHFKNLRETKKRYSGDQLPVNVRFCSTNNQWGIEENPH